MADAGMESRGLGRLSYLILIPICLTWVFQVVPVDMRTGCACVFMGLRACVYARMRTAYVRGRALGPRV